MSRSHLYRTVQSLGGGLISGVSVTVCDPGTTTPIVQLLYATQNGDPTLSNPFLADSGVIDFYLNNAQDVALVLTYGASTLIVDYQQVLPPADEIMTAGGPVTVTNGPSTGFILAGTDSSHAAWVDPADVLPGFINNAMPQPSLPVVLAPPYAGVQLVVWDGKDISGNPMPAGFAQLLIANDTNAVVLGSLDSAGAIVLAVDGPINIYSVAVNKVGIGGPRTDAVSFPAYTPAGGGGGGSTPPTNFSIGTVTTGDPGSAAAASITGDAPDQQLNLTIPSGLTGGIIVVEHDANASMARPTSAPVVYWIGTVRPTNMAPFDLWYDAS